MSSVELICVTKGIPVDMVREAVGLGLRSIGENRVQEASAKHAAIGESALWHLVGHLQTNKARDAVRIFSLIHSLDSVRLAGALDKAALEAGKRQEALVQVNTSGERTKFGIMPEGLKDFLKNISACRNLEVRGLMTIAAETDDPGRARPSFRMLRQLRDDALGWGGMRDLSVLSMGMSDDFEVAIEEGATMVRIGRAIFGGAR